jgi:hypothetical protein
MNLMSSKPLSFKEICAILKTCGESGVASLKLGDLDVSFHHPRAQSHVAHQIEDQYPTTKITETVSETLETDDEVEEFKRAQELITNPEAFELEMIEQATQE